MKDLSFSRTTHEENALLQQWLDHPSVKKWIYIDNWADYYETVSNQAGYFLYSVYESNSLSAHIAAELIDGSIHISLMVNPQKHGHGIGTSALLNMIEKSESLFGKAESITGIVYPGNIASIKCFTKCGFEKLGTDEDGGIMYRLPIGIKE